MKPTLQSRPLIDVMSGKITHNSVPCRVVISRYRIMVGCTDVSIEAARKLVAFYDEKFPPQPIEYVIQNGLRTDKESNQ